MPCIDNKGELTEMAGKILAALSERGSLRETAEETGTPLYRVRSAARELVEAGLAQEKDQRYTLTQTGSAALNKVAKQR